MTQVDVKTCSKCKVEKDTAEFYGKSRSWCRSCESADARERMAAYIRTDRGRMASQFQTARKNARKYGVPDDLKPMDIFFLMMTADSCQYCGKEDTPLTVEHIHPLAHGGPNTFSNLAAVCETCNKSKSNRNLLRWVETKGRADHREIMGVIYRMATRRGVDHNVIIDELNEGYEGAIHSGQDGQAGRLPDAAARDAGAI